MGLCSVKDVGWDFPFLKEPSAVGTSHLLLDLVRVRSSSPAMITFDSGLFPVLTRG
jgi:hypothetical protein